MHSPAVRLKVCMQYAHAARSTCRTLPGLNVYPVQKELGLGCRAPQENIRPTTASAEKNEPAQRKRTRACQAFLRLFILEGRFRNDGFAVRGFTLERLIGSTVILQFVCFPRVLSTYLGVSSVRTSRWKDVPCAPGCFPEIANYTRRQSCSIAYSRLF